MYYKVVIVLAVVNCTLNTKVVVAQTVQGSFTDYGVACPQSNDRGVVATTGAGGKNIVLAWLFDHRGGYALLSIDAQTGNSMQFDVPFNPGDAPYASLLSSHNKFYGYFNWHFVEFDPHKNRFTFSKKGFDQTAMAFTEDDNGLIWAVTYPKCGLVSFNPHTSQLLDYGFLNTESWAQYPRSIAADAEGWVYVGLGNTESQIIAFNPDTHEKKKILDTGLRKRGEAFVYRSENGKVYATSLKGKGEMLQLYKGNVQFTNRPFKVEAAKKYISGNQNLMHTSFSDGSSIKDIDFGERKLSIVQNNVSKTVSFSYTSEGSLVMGVNVAPNGNIIGGTAFPMRVFEFSPSQASFKSYAAVGQFNTSTTYDNTVYFGAYPQGALVKYTVDKNVAMQERFVNQQTLAADIIHIHRPHRVLVVDHLKTILLTGTPEYGYTGGGMLLWNIKNQYKEVLPDRLLIPDQSTISMADIGNGLVLCGTTTAPGTGGAKKATEAALYIFDVKNKRVIWHQSVIAHTQMYADLCKVQDKVFGVTGNNTFFVFDVKMRRIVYEQKINDYGKIVAVQSPRVFVKTPDDKLFMIFEKAIVEVDVKTYKLSAAMAPMPIQAGGAYANHKIYFISGSHLCSYSTLK